MRCISPTLPVPFAGPESDTYRYQYSDAGEEGDAYDTGTYRFTLVYDRTSKNGNCELYVLYKEHYTENTDGSSTNDATAILDMYAVETATGKVAASGRKAWSDVGSEDYRELTGE